MKRASVLVMVLAIGFCAWAQPEYVDLTAETNAVTVVARGTKDSYEGHPTTVATEEGVLAVWCSPHGGGCGRGAVSADGRMWKRIDDRFPKGFARHVNCPSVYRLEGPDGTSRLWIFSQVKLPEGVSLSDHSLRCAYAEQAMPRLVSEDEGRTWREEKPLGQKFGCIMAFASVVRLKDGSYLGLFHRGKDGKDEPPMTVWQSVTRDGGFTWSDPVKVADEDGRHLCEPCVFRSPDGSELCCLMRENTHTASAMAMYSRDEGRHWTRPVFAPPPLAGDRHQVLTLADGRLLVAFRDMEIGSPYRFGFVVWNGTYEQLRGGDLRGSRKFLLFRNRNVDKPWDCGYSGLTLASDGSVLAVTYAQIAEGEGNSVLAIRMPSVANPCHVVDRIADCGRYEALNPHFKKAFEFLKRSDLADLKVGRYEIDGDNCWAMVQEVKLTPLAGAKVEAHRRYIDIQAPITGPETIGFHTMSASQRALPFDEEKDFVLFDAEARSVVLRPGEFALFFPPDGAHAPGHAVGNEAVAIRKLVIKVKAEGLR